MLPFPSPGDLSKPGIEPAFTALEGEFFTGDPPGKPLPCQRDGMGREVGEGIRMGNTCKSMADSCQCMAKTTTML